jgi:hypothetical protein
MNIKDTQAYKAMIKRGDDKEDAYDSIRDMIAQIEFLFSMGDANLMELEEITYDYLGLEPDYLEEIIYGRFV